MKRYDCSIHGECTPIPCARVKANCRGCGEYQSLPELEAMILDLQGPERDRPTGWHQLPLVQEAHRELAVRHLNQLPEYPASERAGRGVVLVGGGKYECGNYVHIRLLREFGCTLPIQVWHRLSVEPISCKIRNLPCVTVIDAESHPARSQWRVLGGWQLKAVAGLWSGFKEWIFSDADNYPVADPTCVFDNNPTGFVGVPDLASCDNSINWDSYGLTPDAGPAINGGTYVIDLERCWKAINLAHHLDMHSEYYYKVEYRTGGFGEQDQIRAALRMAGIQPHFYAGRPGGNGSQFIQVGPDGKPLWVHRIHGKPNPPSVSKKSMRYLAHLPMEKRVHELVNEWGSS